MIGQYTIAKKSSTAIVNDSDEYALLSFIVTPFNDYQYILVQLERNKTNILSDNL